MNYLNGGYAMIKHNASQKDLENAYKTNRPVLVYDENRRAHWAVIEETATESVDEETQEPITIYEYSYRLLDEASVVHLYNHSLSVYYERPGSAKVNLCFNIITNSSTALTSNTWFDTITNYLGVDDNHIYCTNGLITISSINYNIIGIRKGNGIYLYVVYLGSNNTQANYDFKSTSTNVYDIVTQII